MTEGQITFWVPLFNLAATILLMSTTIVYTFFTGRLVKSEYGPKLYVYLDIVDSTTEWNKEIMLDYGCINGPIVGEGFTNKDTKDEKKFDLVVVNNGKAPATNVKIKYKITAFKNEIVYGIDSAEILSYSPVVHIEVEKEINLSYLPPGIKKHYTVFYMATFPNAQLEVESLECAEDKFIKKMTLISDYYNAEFDKLEDNPHLYRLLGI